MADQETLVPEKSLPPLQRQVLAELFSTLQLIYGNRFIKEGDNVTDMMGLWQYLLRAVSDQKIRAASLVVVDHYPTHPPTIGEFRKVINGIKTDEDFEGPALCPKCRAYEFSARHQEMCL